MEAGQQRVENEAYGAFCRRILVKLGQRVADGDPEDLAILRNLRETMARAEWQALDGLIRQGYSYRRIASILGISHVAVRKRHQLPRNTWDV